MVDVVVPWRPGGPDRGRAWAFVNRWWATHYPMLPVHVALAPAGPWNKARAAMPAVEASSADIIVLADADVISDGLGEALQAVKDGAPWAIPHRLVKRLTKDATTSLLDGADPQRLELQQRAYPGVQGGGIVVAQREVILSIPLDCRFVGWGRPGRHVVGDGVALPRRSRVAWRRGSHPPLA